MDFDFIPTFSGKKAIEKQLMEAKSQLTEVKRKNEEEAEVVSRLEEIRKKNMKDLEELNHKLDEVQGANEKLEKSKRKLAAELDDATHELDSHRAKVLKNSTENPRYSWFRNSRISQIRGF